MGEVPFRLVVLGDSTSFFTEKGPQMPSEPALYPNVAARALERELSRPVAVTVIARPGADVRSAWYQVTKDPHIQFDVLMGADAVIVALGSFDSAPLGTPAWLDALLPYLRPASLRRSVRRLLKSAHPWVIRATRARWTRLPMPEFERLFESLLYQVRGLTLGAPGAVLGPTSHRSDFYAHTHPSYDPWLRLQFAVARRQGFAAVPCWPLVEPYADHLNIDGIHWPGEAHAAVGEALAAALLPQITGEAPRPGIPTPPMRREESRRTFGG